MDPTGAPCTFNPLPEPQTAIFEQTSSFRRLSVGNWFEADHFAKLPNNRPGGRYITMSYIHPSLNLCTLNLTPALLARLDAFQIRGLRYILGIEHSFYSHVTNEEIYRKTNIALNKGKDLNISWEEFIRGTDYAQIKQIEKWRLCYETAK